MTINTHPAAPPDLAPSLYGNEDSRYGYDSAAYSPALTSGSISSLLGFDARASGSPNPEDRDSVVPMGAVGLPPDPSKGGERGLTRMFGWSTGLRASRWGRVLLGGQTLVRPSMGVNPAVGPVGYSTFTDRREAGVNALYDEWLPTQRAIQETFTRPSSTASHLE